MNNKSNQKQEEFRGWWHPYGAWGPWGPWGPRPYRRWWYDRPVRLEYPLGPAVYLAEGFEGQEGEGSFNKILAVVVLILLAVFLVRRGRK